MPALQDVAKVKDFVHMFSNALVKDLDVSKWDVSSATDINHM